jgi:potassium intermediate/small conductance calcium-activated channel subfamily N protein 2
MAFAIRSVLRQNSVGNAMIGVDGNLENRQALIREEEARNQRNYNGDPEDSDDWRARQEMEIKRKEIEAEQKRQLHAKKREKITEIQKKLKLNDTVAVILAFLGTLVAFSEVEDNYSNVGKTRNESSTKGTNMRVFVLISSVLLALCSARHYFLNYTVARERQTSSTGIGARFTRSKFFKYMLIEMAFVILHCPPGLDVEFRFTQLNSSLVLSLDSICTCLMLIRTFLLVRVIKHYSRWANEYARAVCEEAGCEAGTFFVMKALFKEKPYIIIGVVMSLTIIIFGLATRTFERPYNVELEDSGKSTTVQNYDYVWNAMWLIVLTITTVGYGDFYPKTHMGRFVIIVACLWGVFIVSIMVVTLNETSKFTKEESKTYEILERLRAKAKCMKSAGDIVVNLMRLNVLKRRTWTKQTEAQVNLYKNRLHRARDCFRTSKQQWKGFDLPDEERLRQLTEKLDTDLDGLKDQIANLTEIEEQLSLLENFQERSLQTVTYSIVHLQDLISLIEKEQDLAD